MLFLRPFFGNFLSFFHAKFLFFARLGGLFDLRKHRSLVKTLVFGGLGVLFGKFFCLFLSFFLNVLPQPSGPASAAVAVPTAVNADSRFTLAGGWLLVLCKKNGRAY